MRVLYVSPTTFDDASVIGGAERYAWELARAVAADADVRLVTFGDRARRWREGGLEVEQLPRGAARRGPLAANPLRWPLLRAIAGADVVHAHQVHTWTTDAAVIGSRLARRPVFVSDLGGGHTRAISSYLPIMRLAAGFLLLSEYSRAQWSRSPASTHARRLEVIYGGVDVERFIPGGAKDPHLVVVVGRLVPHKGIEHAIDAVEAPFTLHVIGRPYDQAYLAFLRDRARGRPVVFEHDLDDRGLIDRYRAALAAVQPSVATDWRGRTTTVAELFGLAAVEAMACGTPAIVSRTASLPELVDDGRTGFVVAPADAAAIRARLAALRADPSAAEAMGARARAAVLERFTWRATAARCLALYREAIAS